MKDNKDFRCSFCGKRADEVRLMLESGNSTVYICDDCVDKCNTVITDELAKKGIEYEWKNIEHPVRKPIKYCSRTPEDVKQMLDDYIIGQEHAKKVLAVAIYNHRKRLSSINNTIRKSNILLAGPSGCGKTLIAQTVSRILDVPFIIADATSYTQAGYIGADVESMLVRLLDAAHGCLEDAQKGIIYLDEFDKLARRSCRAGELRDISGEGVQQALLKIMEGSKLEIPVTKGHNFTDKITFDTSNVLFICGGAFESLTMEEPKQNQMGFQAAEKESAKDRERITSDKLKEFGIIPELIGRIPVIAQLDPLNVHDLVSVMTDVKGSILDEYKELFAIDGVDLQFTESAIQRIAEIAIQRGTGARGLRSIIEDVMLDIMYSLPSRLNSYSGDFPVKCTVTEKTITTKKPTLRISANA